MKIDELNELTPQVNWKVLFETAQFPVDATFLVSQPSFFEAAGKIFADTSLETWKDYLSFQTISQFSPVMGDQYEQLSFNFYSKGLRGVADPEPRWKRAVDSVNGNMGELLGQLYVEKYFQAESKGRMDIMIQNLIKAYEVSIKDLEWMSDDTKRQALRMKLLTTVGSVRSSVMKSVMASMIPVDVSMVMAYCVTGEQRKTPRNSLYVRTHSLRSMMVMRWLTV